MKFHYRFYISSFWFMQMYFIHFHHIVFVAFQGCIIVPIQYHSTLVASLNTNNIVWIFFQKFQ
jgi:hypothetical protein